MTAAHAPAATDLTCPGLTAETISGCRRANSDFCTSNVLADRLGRAWCIWAVPPWTCRRGDPLAAGLAAVGAWAGPTREDRPPLLTRYRFQEV